LSAAKQPKQDRMKKLLLFSFLLVTVNSFAQNDLSWYKMLKGKIGTYPVTMHLHKAGHDFRGYYYYDNYQLLLAFNGDDTTTKGKITLNVQGEQFVFAINKGIASGTWTKLKNKPLDFSASEAAAPLAFTYVYSSGSTKLRPALKDGPEASISQSSVWPTCNSTTALYTKNIIREHFGAKDSREEIGAIFLKYRKKTIAEYVSDNKEMSDEEIKESSFAYSYEVDDEMMVCFQSPKILSLAGYSYSYTGGAHGNYGTTYIAINLASNKKFTVDDVITKDGLKVLSSLLEKNFRKQYEVKPTEKLSEAGLFEDKIEPNDNFFLTGRGIWFAYNHYVLGPYFL
jgi:hypothetical protein